MEKYTVQKRGIQESFFFTMIILAVCYFSTAVIMINAVDKYMWLAILPLSFSVLTLMFNRIFKLIGKSITITLLVALMFLKNVIMPLFMALGDGYFAAIVDTESKMLMAVLLQLYEEVAVFTVLHLRQKRLKSAIINSFMGKLNIKKEKAKAFTIITFIVFAVVIICLFAYPQLAAYISFGIETDTNEIIKQARLQIMMKETVPTIVYYLYTVTVNVLRWLLPAMVIVRMYISKRKETAKIVISFLAIGVSAIAMTDTVAISIYLSIAYSLLLCKMYPEKRKRILTFAVVVVCSLGALWLFIKTFGDRGLKDTAIGEIAYMLQAYFGGPENVAVALSITTPLSFSQILADIVKHIPFAMYFFKDLVSTNDLFNQVYWGSRDISTQIIPMISQGARHFTPFFAPIYTVIITNIAIRWETKATFKGELLDYTVCAVACVCFSMSVAMYNASLCIQMYLNYIFPVQVIVWMIKKIYVRQ